MAAVILDDEPPNDSLDNLDALVEEPPEKNPESELSGKKTIGRYSYLLS